MNSAVCQGLLPTIRHFENRRGEGPGDEVAVDDGGNYVTVHELNVRRIIRHNESLSRLSSTNSVKNETS